MNTRLWILIALYCCFRNGECTENGTELAEQKGNGRFLIGCDVAVTRIPPDNIPELEVRMGKLFCLVFERATHERLGQSVMRMSRTLNFSSELCKVDVQENRVLDTHVQLIFTISYDDVLVDAAVATKEISRLTLSHLSATLGFPIVSLYDFETPPSSKVQWWLILIIIGCSIMICLAGWLLMFIYYNTCALPIRQYTTYIDQPKPEQPSNSLAPPTDTTQIRQLTERESLASPKSVPPALPQNDDVSTKTIMSADQITGGLVELPEALEIELHPIEKSNVPQDTKHEVPDPYHKPPPVKPRQIETLKEFPLPERWSPYFAGDRVQAILLQEPRYHPQPGMKTEDGVLRFRTSNQD